MSKGEENGAPARGQTASRSGGQRPARPRPEAGLSPEGGRSGRQRASAPRQDPPSASGPPRGAPREGKAAQAEAGSSEDLRHRSISAVLWGAFGAFLRAALQTLSQIILARLLGPEQFGVFALALVVVFFSTFFADVGLAYGLIQRKNVRDQDIRFVFTWQAILGTVMTLIVFASAPHVADFYGDVRLVEVLRWLSVTCLIGALGSTASTLLRKDLNFRAINLATVISYAIGFLCFGVPMAISGYGVEALVVAFLVQTTLQTVYQMLARPHPMRPLLWQPASRELLGFGGTVLLTNLINWVMNSVDRVVVGRTMSMTATGLYSTVSNFISGPTITVLAMLQSVLYSASARVQDNAASLRTGLRAMIGIVGLAFVPVFFTIAVVAATFMRAVYGERWVGGEVVLTPLALAMPAVLLMGLSTPILWTSGNVKQEFKLQIPIAILWTVVLVVVSRYESLVLLSWSVLALYYVRAAVIIGATIRAVQLRFVEVLKLLAPGLVVTAGVVLTAMAVDRGLAGFVPEAAVRLLLIILACALALAVMIRVVRSLLPSEVRDLTTRLADRLPGPGRRMVRGLLGAG